MTSAKFSDVLTPSPLSRTEFTGPRFFRLLLGDPSPPHPLRTSYMEAPLGQPTSFPTSHPIPIRSSYSTAPGVFIHCDSREFIALDVCDLTIGSE